MDQHEDISNKDALGGSTDEEGSNDDEANHVNKKISSKHTHVGNIMNRLMEETSSVKVQMKKVIHIVMNIHV